MKEHLKAIWGSIIASSLIIGFIYSLIEGDYLIAGFVLAVMLYIRQTPMINKKIETKERLDKLSSEIKNIFKNGGE